jgi:hypothetical protein
MTRRIVTPADAAYLDRSFQADIAATGVEVKNFGDKTVAPTKADDYGTKLLKLIPAEIVAVFITIDGIIRSADRTDAMPWIYWLVFVVLTLGTYLYVSRAADLPLLSKPSWQALLSTISFVVWVFAVGGPFKDLNWYDPVYGAILLPLYTFLIPLLIPLPVWPAPDDKR